MNSKQFPSDFKQMAEKVKQFIHNDMPDIIGTEAVNHVNQAFQDEGHTDKTLAKWKPRKEKTRKDGSISPKEATRLGRKILTGATGELGKATTYEKDGLTVTLINDKPYAEAHNEGTTTAGRGNKTTIPQRQFIGDSEQRDQKIIDKATRQLDTIINT